MFVYPASVAQPKLPVRSNRTYSSSRACIIPVDFWASKKQAFTLIELLVVIVIIALLAALLLPALNRAKEQSYRAQCQNNLRQMSISMASYLDDHDDWFPVLCHETWWRKVDPVDTNIWSPYGAIGEYLGADGDAFQCPGAMKAPYQITTPAWVIRGDQPSYGLNRTISPIEPDTPNFNLFTKRYAQRLTRITDHAGTFFFFDGNWRGIGHGYHANPFTEGRFFWFAHRNDAMVSFLDGHVKSVGFSEWKSPRVDQNSTWCSAKSWNTLWK